MRRSAVIVLAAWLACPAPHAFTQAPLGTAAPILQDLHGVADLRSLFERDRDKVRIRPSRLANVTLLCSRRPVGAARAPRTLPTSQSQHLCRSGLEIYPDDARSTWPSALLTDPRVVHYWDEPRTIGRLYLSNLPAMFRSSGRRDPSADGRCPVGRVFSLRAWGPVARPLPLPAAWGYPIMVTRDQLLRQVRALLGRSNAPLSCVMLASPRPCLLHHRKR